MADKPTTPPPAYFLSLSLENVRSFGAKQTISFATKEGKPAQWTIILGDNGVGKTTVLKALAVLSPSPTPIGNDNNETPSFPPKFFSNKREKWMPTRGEGKSSGSIKCTYYVNDNDLEYLKEGQVVHPRKISLHFDMGENGLYIGGGSSLFSEDELGLIAYGYGAGRTIGNSTIGETPANADTYISLFDDRADLLDPQEWFLNIDYGSRLAGTANTKLADARDRVEKMLIDVLPGVTKIQIAVAGTPQKPQISLQFLLHNNWIRLRDMSLGYQTLVVWLTDLASKLYIRYPESNNPLAESAIVLVDEIDLHLHPKWQRELLSTLSKIFLKTQFIVTAHSPLVVQAASDEGANVVLLRREGDQTIVSQNPEDVRGWRVDQILTSSFFNLETARSVQTEEKLTRQAALLNKAKLTAKERRELEALTQELEGQPMGSTSPHAEAEEAELLRQITERLGQ